MPCAFLIASLLALVPDGPPRSRTSSPPRTPQPSPARPASRATPARGAVVFYQKHLACTACHGDPGVDRPPLGPDLAAMGPGVTDAYLVESILNPSREVKKGFEPVTIATVDGKTLTGLIVEERPDRLTLRDPAEPAKPITIPAANIESRKAGGPSLMPAGLANALGLAAGVPRPGPLPPRRRRRRPRPGPRPPARPEPARPEPLPEYERDIDHAGLISGLNEASLKRGQAVYEQVCANCHGTPDRPGSMPTSLRFASGDVQGRRRPVRDVPDPDARLRADAPAVEPGAPAEVRRDPLHPRGDRQGAEPLAIQAGRRAATSRACRRASREGRRRSSRSRGRRWITARP